MVRPRGFHLQGRGGNFFGFGCNAANFRPGSGTVTQRLL